MDNYRFQSYIYIQNQIKIFIFLYQFVKFQILTVTYIKNKQKAFYIKQTKSSFKVISPHSKPSLFYYSQQKMSTRQNRKSLNVLNDTLKADNITLKNRQMQMLSHIQTLIRREKQLSQLKQQLIEEVQKSKFNLEKQKIQKNDKCIVLEIQLQKMQDELVNINMTITNLEEQYQFCLADYDNILSQIASIIQKNKVIQLQVFQEKEKKSTIQTMIFDYERLQRVLQEERKYFKQLSNNQQKSHAERMKQFQSIRLHLIKQEKQTFQKKFQDRFKIGFIKLSECFKTKLKTYAQIFFRGNYKYQKLTDLGVSKFKNCLQIASFRYKKQVRRFFSSWHHNAFKKDVLNNLVENSLRLNFESKTKIKVLNKIIQKLNSDNLNLLHLYQRTKIVCTTANSIKHKQIHLVFCRWRQQSSYLTRIKHHLEKTYQILPIIFKRNAFNLLKQRTHYSKRFEVASHLLKQYQNSKDLAWALRKWRLQLQNRQIQVVEKYVENIKKHNLVQQRVKYQKRKVKALTNLQMQLLKIQMRNYFNRYYQNVKKSKIFQIDENIQKVRDQCVQARKQSKSVKIYYKQKYRNLSLASLFSWMNRNILNYPFQFLKREYEKNQARSQALMIVILKKQGKNKYYAMNEFRKNVQSYQKKQMHQQLTDLNNKMEAINEKSSKFREALKNTIQELGNQSSKKINQLFQYTLNCQKKVFFNWYSRKEIQKRFKYYLIAKTLQIFTRYASDNVFKTLQNHQKNLIQQKIITERQEKFLKSRSEKLVRKTFDGILKQLKLHKSVFSKFIHAQNVMYFYRLEYAFISIIKRAHEQTIKLQHKAVSELNSQFKGKKQLHTQLKTDQSNLQEKLKNIFIKFVNFQEISQKNKEKQFTQNQKRKYFSIYRKNIQNKKYLMQVLTSFMKLVQYKNYFIFWKSIMVISTENQQSSLKDELGKINKKKKAFEQKTSKTRRDIERKMAQQEKQHQEKQYQANYYLQKYTGILAYYDKNHENLQKIRYLRSIFYVWKRQWQGAKKFGSAIYNILRRTQLVNPYRILFDQFRKYDNQYKSQLICAKLIQKKYKQQLSDGFNYWRYNMRHGYTDKIRYKIDHIDQHYEQIKEGIFSRGQFYANQVLRNKKYNLLATTFMNIKNQWVNAKQTSKKITPLLKKTQKRRLFQAVRNWKWLIFYKNTKRAYLKHKKQQYETGLKKDVFTSLKIYRQQIYELSDLTVNFIANRSHQFKRFAMSKIINIGSFEKNELNYERRKALHTLLMNKTTREKTIKRTVMWKWQSQLIPRQHYMCNILKSIEKRILKSAFANINQKKFWNQFYIKDIAQKITTEGYSDVNSVTTLLIKEGFDPDQLKDFLRIKNQTDNKMISKAIGHMKTWPLKPHMIQAFHSWKQYVLLRKNIKKSLTKVLNFSSGLGRYFDKWKKKDPAFNQILQKQSRVNMLQRYRQLERLMKQYKRDVKDSLQNCEQLRKINDQHAKSTRMTVQMALSNLANSVHKGMKQGLEIWRIKAKQQKTLQTNQRYDELVDGIQILDEQKRKVRQRIKSLQNQNMQLKQKCKWGEECGQLLKKLMSQKDGLTIDLAQKQHNLKILLQDNLRLKQKIKIAKDTALKLINKVRQQQHIISQ